MPSPSPNLNLISLKRCMADYFEALSRCGQFIFTTRILRACVKELCFPLAHLFNLSLRTGKMPTLWKSANITEIHKRDSRELVTNYRSISLLPIPAKCFKRIVHSAIYDHVSPLLQWWESYLSNRRLRVFPDDIIILFLVRCLLWSSSGLLIRALIFLLYLLVTSD